MPLFWLFLPSGLRVTHRRPPPAWFYGCFARYGSCTSFLRVKLATLCKSITPGARADFVLVDIAHPAIQPVYDPVRSLVYAAGERAIRHVFVGGQQVVHDGKALAFDYADASARLEMAQRRAIEKVPGFDWAGRSAAEIIPPTFPSK